MTALEKLAEERDEQKNGAVLEVIKTSKGAAPFL